MQDDLERTFQAVVPHNDGRRNTKPPGTLHDLEHARLVILEPVSGAVARFQDKCYKVAEVIVDDRIDLCGERVVGVALMIGLAGRMRQTVAEWERLNFRGLAAEGFDATGNRAEVTLKDWVPAIRVQV